MNKSLPLRCLMALSLLTLLTLSAAATEFTSDGLRYVVNDDGETVTVYQGNKNLSGPLTIPSSVSDGSKTYTVTIIGEYAFCENDNLTGSLIIPNSVTAIGNYAFTECFGFTSLTLGNSLTTIGYAAFSGCENVTGTLTIPNSVTTIGYGAFRNCESLTSLTIPNSVTSLDGNPFSSCEALETITVATDNPVYDSRNNCNAIIEKATGTLISGCKSTIIPGTVTTIGNSAFWGCDGLTSVTIPNSVTSIGDGAFGYTGLTSVTIPNSVTTIDHEAFRWCESLTSVSIPKSVTTMVTLTFADCSNLKDVHCGIINPQNDLTYGFGLFYDVPMGNCTLHVPKGCISNYRNSEQWQDFGNIVEESEVTGDISGDGIVDVSDVSFAIDIVLGKAEYNHLADMDNSGKVDVTDISLMIDIVLGKVPSGGDDPATQTITVNGVSFKMVAVEGGTFTMGATAEQGSYYQSDERPTHEVTLSSYSIGATEVTQELWVAVMGSNPSFYNEYGNSDYDSYHNSDNYGSNLQRPVECVSLDDCQEFIAKLNQLTGKTFRLPTEAEWEYAARGGNKSKGYMYAGSNTIVDVAWYDNNSDSQTHSVASKAPNELGLYDMSGNVYEWCSDWYAKDYYSISPNSNPTGPSTGTYRVCRGGSWRHAFGYGRVSDRINWSVNYRRGFLGLRLAL